MALKAKLSKDEHAALADPLKEHYKPNGDGFVLEAHGLVDADQLKQFRENNIALAKERDALKERYKDVDPDEYRDLKVKVTPPAKPPADDIARQIQEHVEKATKPLQRQLEIQQREKEELKAKAQKAEFTRIVTNTAGQAGVLPDYHEDVLHRAQSRGFRLIEDGVVKARKGEKADEPVIGDDGKELDLETFVKNMPAAFFGTTRGSGPANTNSGATAPMNGVLLNPDALTFGRHAEDIAKGKVRVVRT